jgi:hypothetical protein
MDLTYTDAETKPSVGDVVMAPGMIRGIVVEVKAVSVRILGIATDKATLNTFVLKPRFVQDSPIGDCMYMQPQHLNFPSND